jgi:hypothetical protein
MLIVRVESMLECQALAFISYSTLLQTQARVCSNMSHQVWIDEVVVL